MPTPSETGRATFTVELGDLKCAASGDAGANGAPTMRGHAAVFNRLSHDLGGFRVKIAPGAFTKILDTAPDVHLVWDHNTRYTLARTKNKSLELREDPLGLHVWARMANTPTAHELATLMDGGYIDQMSFACDIGASEWTEDDAGNITRTIFEVDGLFDVCVCAQGAFPQTDAQLVASLNDAGEDLAAAIAAGHVLGRDSTTTVAATGPGGEENGIALTEDEARAREGLPPLVDTGAADVADSDETRVTELLNWAKAQYLKAHTAR